MAREVTLNDPAAVQFIKENFIPWAGINSELFYDKKSPDEVHNFAQRVGLKPNNSTSYQVVSNRGKLIAVWDTNMSPSIHYGRQLVAFLEKALEKTDKLPPREVASADRSFDDRGVGVLDDGTAKLAVTTRRPDKTGKGRGLMVDSLVISTPELDALRPPISKLGAKYTLPDLTSRRFIEVCVHADSLFAVKPSEATVHELRAQVTRVEDGLVETTFRGQLGLRTNGQWQRVIGHGKGDAQGRLRFDNDGHLQELLLIYDGHFHNWYSRGWDPDYPVQGVIEWHRSVQE